MFLANGSTGRRFDAVDKIGNRIARRNGNQEVDVISLSGKIENPNLKSIQDAVWNFLYSTEYGSGDCFSSISYDQYQMNVDVVDAVCATA